MDNNRIIYYDSPIRAAEMSRTHRAMSRDRYSVIYEGRKVMANLLYEKGDYRLTFAGLPLTTVRGTEYFHLVDRCRSWRPL